HEVLHETRLQQWLQVTHPAQALDRLRRYDHVGLDVWNAGRDVRSEDIAPGNRHGAARLAVAHELARFPGQGHDRHFAVDPRAAALGHAFDAGLRRARTRPAAGLEGEYERGRIRQALFEHRGQAVGRDDVEARARQHDDALVPGAAVGTLAQREHVD